MVKINLKFGMFTKMCAYFFKPKSTSINKKEGGIYWHLRVYALVLFVNLIVPWTVQNEFVPFLQIVTHWASWLLSWLLPGFQEFCC